MTDPTWSPPPPEFTSDPPLTLPVARTKPFTFTSGVGAELGWGSGVGGVDGADGTELNVPDAVAEAVALASAATCAASGAVLSGRSDFVFLVLSPREYMMTPQLTEQYGQVLRVSVVRASLKGRMDCAR